MKRKGIIACIYGCLRLALSCLRGCLLRTATAHRGVVDPPMASFKDTLSALGHFWPSTKADNKWPGKLSIETFPKARLHCIGAAPGDGKQPLGRLTFHGLTEGGECVTMFEAAAPFAGLSLNAAGETHSINVTANYMLVASDHFDDGATVRRLTFASSLAEHVFRLWAAPDYKEVHHRKFGGVQFDRPILHKQAASYVDFERKIRVRVFRPTVPTASIDPKSLWAIDFLELVTPSRALKVLHEFRALLALLCGDLIDLWNVRLLHKKQGEDIFSSLYFADPVKHPTNSNGFPHSPILDIGHDRSLFRKVIATWLAEIPARRIGRGVFHAILQDKGTLRFSHLRDLVTLVEMHETHVGTLPLSKTLFDVVRKAFKASLNEFAAKDPDSAKWLETMEKRVDLMNYFDAKIRLANFIKKLPEGFVSAPEKFTNDVINLRNTLVHDIVELKTDDQNKLAYFVAKLKALYVLSDAISLGARPDDINKGSRFFIAAKLTPRDVFTGGPSDDDDDDE
jgi:hypothetical protein